MKHLVHTDFISQSAKQIPDPQVRAWLNATEETSLYLSVVTLHEIRTGIELKTQGKKREALELWFERLLARYEGRILQITPAIALMSGTAMARAKLDGHTAELGDCLIAATANAHGLWVATLNRKHYARLGVPLLELES